MQTKKLSKIILAPLLTTVLVIGHLLSPITATAYTISEPEETSLPILTFEEAKSGDTPDEFLVLDTSSSPMLRNAMLGYSKWTLTSQVKQKNNTFIAWHPNFKGYKYNVSYYYFSSSQFAKMSVNLGYGPISLSINKSSGSGIAIKSNPKKWTRPGVYGDIYKNKYNIKKYNGANILTGTSTKYTSTVKKQYVKSVNK
ncbi:hypothetical protein [Paenilisteria rocourtiae]|uniref:Uncharacterized protein n=1 Tax=Listeria rocourtiae TaxID=647910 RepID=A0A4R6ZS97_9LIST|nr:hypothetical protein [Listeria rocourtiae]EUJ43141.1 hypothetical protein PROCOU_15919 [Listeria rocourtiae FSL F6-920]TDR55587.1 hypothetical protein DFP96_101524 [Listeria rocourtiae]